MAARLRRLLRRPVRPARSEAVHLVPGPTPPKTLIRGRTPHLPPEVRHLVRRTIPLGRIHPSPHLVQRGPSKGAAGGPGPYLGCHNPPTPPPHQAPTARNIPAWGNAPGTPPPKPSFHSAEGRSEAAGETTNLSSSPPPTPPNRQPRRRPRRTHAKPLEVRAGPRHAKPPHPPNPHQHRRCLFPKPAIPTPPIEPTPKPNRIQPHRSPAITRRPDTPSNQRPLCNVQNTLEPPRRRLNLQPPGFARPARILRKKAGHPPPPRSPSSSPQNPQQSANVCV